MRKQLESHFKTLKIGDVIGETRDILYLNEKMTVKTAIEQLSKHDVRSAPVKEKTDVTFLDYECFLEFFIDSLRKVDSNLNLAEHKHAVEELLHSQVSKVTGS